MSKNYTVYYDVVTTYMVRVTEQQMRHYGIEFDDAAHLAKMLQRSGTKNPGKDSAQPEAFEDMASDIVSNRERIASEDIIYDSIFVKPWRETT